MVDPLLSIHLTTSSLVIPFIFAIPFFIVAKSIDVYAFSNYFYQHRELAQAVETPHSEGRHLKFVTLSPMGWG